MNLGWRGWVKFSEEERPWRGEAGLGGSHGWQIGERSVVVMNKTWGPNRLGQMCSATCRWYDWISVPPFLICKMGVIVGVVPASQGCVKTESWISVCCWYVSFLFLFYR